MLLKPTKMRTGIEEPGTEVCERVYSGNPPENSKRPTHRTKGQLILIPRVRFLLVTWSMKRRALEAAITGCPKITDIQILACISAHAQKLILREGREE